MSDPRFARLKTDPRFRKPKQKALKVELDDRFRDVLESEEFGGKGVAKGKGKGKAQVDKRGRPLASSHHQDQLKRFYRLRSPDADAEDVEGAQGKGFVDYARGEGVLSSSGSEDESSEAEEEELEVGGKRRLPIHAFDDDEGSEDESGSGSGSGSGSDGDHLEINLSEDDEEGGPSAFPPEADDLEGEAEEEEEEESAEPSKRIAAVNLDWDNLRATDLYAVFNSFLRLDAQAGASSSERGRLVDVKIYPSEFGKERMAKEEQEGPGGGIFVGSKAGAGKQKQREKRKEGLVRQKDLEESDEDESDVEDQTESEYDDDDDLEEDEEEEGDEDDGDEDAMPRKSSTRPRQEIDGLEIISDVESDAGSEDIDMDQLRQYQLERLRYFYAIATFSTVAAAKYVMDECNGTEFERTANIMDLSYVPEGMEFADDEVRDEATKEPKAYKGNDFVTDALRHSKVKLTWDQDDPNRIKMTRRTLTREEIEEEDFKNLVASSGSEDEDEVSQDEEAESSKTPNGKSGKSKTKKQAAKERTEKLRALLLAADDDEGDVWGKAGTAWADELEDIRSGKGKGKGTTGAGSEAKGKKEKKKGEGDMEITFRPGLSVKASTTASGVADEDGMTTLERYQLRMKEKRARKKDKMEIKKGLKGVDSDGNAESGSENEGGGGAKALVVGKDDFFGSDDSSEEEVAPVSSKGKAAKGVGKSKEGKSITKAEVKAAPAPTSQEEEELAHLTALVGSAASASGGETNFSMKDILRAEKEGKTKRRRRKPKGATAREEEKEQERELGKEGWKIDVADPRFKALHEEAEFAIDPSDPHFTKTQAMKDLLAERTRVRNAKAPRDKQPSSNPISNPESGGQEKDLNSLVESVKRKMEGSAGKKRKRSRK